MALRLGDIMFSIGVRFPSLREAGTSAQQLRERLEKLDQAITNLSRNNLQQAGLKVDQGTLRSLQDYINLLVRMRETAGQTDRALRSLSSRNAQIFAGMAGPSAARQAKDLADMQRLAAAFGQNEVNALFARMQAAQSGGLTGSRSQLREQLAADRRAVIALEQALAQATRMTEQLRAATSAGIMGNTSAQVRAINDALKQYAASVLRASGDTGQLNAAWANLQTRLSAVNAQLMNAQRTAGVNLTPWTGLRNAMDRVAQSSILMLGPLSGVAVRLRILNDIVTESGIRMAALVVGFTAAFAAAIKLGQSMLTAGVAMSRYEVQLQSVFGAQTRTTEALNHAIAAARNAGTELDATVTQYARWSAAIQGTALEGAEGNRIFGTFAQVIGRLQLNTEQARGVFRSLEQMVSKGVVQMEELKNQLGDRLPGAMRIAAAAMGISIGELQRMTRASSLLTTDFLPRFATAIQRAFNINLDQPVNSYQSSVNRMRTSWTQFMAELDRKVGLTAIVQRVIDGLTFSFDKMRESLTLLMPLIVITGIALSGLALVAMVGAIGRVSAMVTALAGSFAGLGTILATLSGLLLGVVAIVGGYTILMGALTSSTNQAGQATGGLNQGFRQLISTVVAGITFIAGIVATLLRFTLIGRILIVAGAAMAYLGFSSAQAASGVDQLTRSMDTLNTEVDSYIRSQEQMLQEQSATTEGMIANLEEQIAAATGAINSLQRGLSDRIEQAQRDWENSVAGMALALIGDGAAIRAEFEAISRRITAEANAGAAALAAQVDQIMERIARLRAILERQRARERDRGTPDDENPTGRPSGSSRGATNRRLILEDFELRMQKINREIQALGQGPAAVERLREAFAREDEVRRFQKSMERAGISTAEAARRAEQLRTALENLALAEKRLGTINEAITALADAGKRAFDTFASDIADALAKGELSMQTFADIARKVAADIIKTFLQVAITNPLKNLIFGGTAGNIFGIFNTGGVGGTAGVLGRGAAFDSTARRMASGGILSRPTRMMSPIGPVIGGEAGEEAIMPLARNSRGQLGVRSDGAGQRPVQVIINTPNIESFRRSEAQVGAVFARVMARGSRNM